MWLFRYDLTNTAALPAGTKYIKISFPTDFEAKDPGEQYTDDTNGVVLGHVNLTFSTPDSITISDTSPAAPAFAASSIKDGASDTALDTDSITLVFNNVMNAQTVNASTISINNGLGISSITPLDNNKTYRIAFDAHYGAIQPIRCRFPAESRQRMVRQLRPPQSALQQKTPTAAHSTILQLITVMYT